MHPIVGKKNIAPSQACENGTPKSLDSAARNLAQNKELQERNKSIFNRLNKSSLLELCEENSVGEFHLIEECEEEHCLIAQQVFRLMTDLVQKCSEIDPRSAKVNFCGQEVVQKERRCGYLMNLIS